ncbi:hypothetical protein SAMN05216308_10110 [Nitrosospira sp. Nsp13]|nr:hypothetical protein SAMN05216308_10110 [Nitrosospira sp. Nsp13]
MLKSLGRLTVKSIGKDLRRQSILPRQYINFRLNPEHGMGAAQDILAQKHARYKDDK